MTIKDLLPWRSQRAVARTDETTQDPFVALQTQINRLFDDVWGGTSALSPWGDAEAHAPKADVSETDSEVLVSVEVPGMAEKDVHVTLDGNALVVSGEKKAERESKDSQYHRIERSYGSFRRIIPLPTEVDEGKAEATYKQGVLNVRLPKLAESKSGRRKIAVKGA